MVHDQPVEDDELWATIRKLYGPLMEISLVFPSLRKNQLTITLSVFLFYLVAFPVHVVLLTITIKDCVWDDFNVVSLEFHYWLLLIFAVASLGFMFSNRDHFVNFHRCLMQDLAVYQSGRIYSEDEPKRYEKEKRAQLIRFMFLPGLIFSLAGVALLVPYFKKMDGNVQYNAKGANMKLPIPGCYPFPTHEGILHLLVVLGQLMAASGMASIIASLDLLIFRCCQSIIFEYRVLQYAVRTIFQRATILRGNSDPDSRDEDWDEAGSNYQNNISECLKDCIAHHYKIQYLMEEFESMMSMVTGFAYLIGTGVIGLSLLNILDAMEAKNYENVIIFAMFGMAEVLSILVLSYFGECLKTEGAVLRDELYFIDWFELNQKNRKIILNFQVGISEPRILRGGAGTTELRLETFSTIMNTAYSFFNLIRASKD